MRTILTFLAVVTIFAMSAQSDPLTGTYSGFYDGDQITLVISSRNGNIYTGTMRDSYQTYEVRLTSDGNAVTGTAREASYDITFQVSGNNTEQGLDLKFEITLEGAKATMDISLTKQGRSRKETHTSSSFNEFTLPAGTSHPEFLLGTWVKEELYQSGYGDNYMGGGVSQSWTLLPEGQIAEGGSNAYVSGNNYSGQSSDHHNQIIPNVLWYTIQDQLYLLVKENGDEQTQHLGRFYVENGSMLITAPNGEKTLLHKQ